jgi:hypothetical protein
LTLMIGKTRENVSLHEHDVHGTFEYSV